MKRVSSSILMVISMVMTAGQTVMAHSPSETHTSVNMSSTSVIVRVDLPWTVNEAARNFYNLKSGEKITDAETFQYIRNYLPENLVLMDQDQKLTPVSVSPVPQDHSHSLVFELVYEKIDSRNLKVKNTLLFELHPERQKNYISLTNELGQTKETYTDPDRQWAEFEPEIAHGSSSTFSFIDCLAGFFLILSFMVINRGRVQKFL